jgi:aminopeptidase
MPNSMANPVPSASPDQQLARYADLLLTIGVNLQPGQSLIISAELGHAPLVRAAVAAAYAMGAPYVHVQWLDMLTMRAHAQNVHDEYLESYPAFEVAARQQMVDESWGRLAIVGPDDPDALSDVDPSRLRQIMQARRRATRFYADAQMANHFQWCVAAAPTPAWAAKIFPELAPTAAEDALWELILQTCRVDRDDPVGAWQAHDAALNRVANYLMAQQVRALRFVDTVLADDGLPATDLTVGLTDTPKWVAASSARPDGVRFLPNMPTEEIFTTPHAGRTNGYVRTSKPCFPFEQRVPSTGRATWAKWRWSTCARPSTRPGSSSTRRSSTKTRSAISRSARHTRRGFWAATT